MDEKDPNFCLSAVCAVSIGVCTIKVSVPWGRDFSAPPIKIINWRMSQTAKYQSEETLPFSVILQGQHFLLLKVPN